ncbi:alpha [Umbelopsis nana]
MLSSQTKDAITAAAMRNLQERIPGGLSVDNVISCDKDLIHECIKSVGFHTRKTYYIKDTATILKEKFDGDIPDTIEGLTSLPGVGPKMGYLALQCAWNKNAGIGVDVHVHRIANRLGWVKTANGTPEDTREASAIISEQKALRHHN